MSEALAEFITLGGGIAGYASVAYLLWKKFRKDIRVYGISGTYEEEKSKTKGLSNIHSTIEIGFLIDRFKKSVSDTKFKAFLQSSAAPNQS